MSEPDREDREERRPIDKLSGKRRHVNPSTPETQQRHGNRGPLNRRSRSQGSGKKGISQSRCGSQFRCATSALPRSSLTPARGCQHWLMRLRLQLERGN
jgi:hypothetical protein